MTLTPIGYMPRIADTRLKFMLDSFGAVCVEGPKWCGKTWFSLNQCNSATLIGDPRNNFETRNRVMIDVDYAFRGDRPHLIDEWQEVPSLWDATRFNVDKYNEKGIYVLTGSSTPVYKGIYHSGAGRIGRMRMRTMSLYESGDSDGSVTLSSIFDGTFSGTDPKEVSLERLIYLTVRGGWPGNIGIEAHNAEESVRNYLLTAVEDASRLDGIFRISDKIAMVIRSLARNESTLASGSRILTDISDNETGSISDKTLKEYMGVLDRLFIIENQPPFDPNMRPSVRVGKSVKRHLTDPALSAAALGFTCEMLEKDLLSYGFLFEAMCERDLQIYSEAIGGRLCHYRDGKGNKIDAVIELSDGRWGAFEIKLGANMIDEAAKNLVRLQKFFIADGNARPPSVLCVICGMTSFAYRRADGVYVVPITSLKP